MFKNISRTKKFLKDVKKDNYRDRHWRKKWLPFIKYDHDWDGYYLIQLIVYKLHVLFDFYSNRKNVHMVEEERIAIVDSLQHAIDLGEKLLDNSINEPVYNFLEKHHTMSYEESSDGVGLHKIKMIWDTDENGNLYRKIDNLSIEIERKATREFFAYLAENYYKWWD